MDFVEAQNLSVGDHILDNSDAFLSEPVEYMIIEVNTGGGSIFPKVITKYGSEHIITAAPTDLYIKLAW